MSQTTKNIAASIKAASVAKTSPYDTQGTVKRIEGSTAWVHIPGGVDETPVKMTISAKIGDNVQVRVGDGSAWLVGNASAPPTDDTTANTAVMLASTAEEESKIAHNAAVSAVASAADAKATANSVHGIAVQAQADADEAKAAAGNASEYAARALGNLSTVQSVTETLNWITQHGTMALTTDVALDPTHVYFVVDPLGDYVVGGTHYSVVTEPDVDDIGTYYELTIDESLNNYVGTHLALTSEGLWLLPASSGTNKVLIATGNGSTYTTAGTYIVSGSTVLAEFTTSGAQIGKDGETRAEIDYHSLQLIDGRKNPNVTYFHVSNILDSEGKLTETFAATGTRRRFGLSQSPIENETTVKVDGVTITSGLVISGSAAAVIFDEAPTSGSVVTIIYTPDPGYRDAKWLYAHTFGTRSSESRIGALSTSEGYNNEASSFCSHAEGEGTISQSNSSHSEGQSTKALSPAAHAEGCVSEARREYSHAQNHGTIANTVAQTALGKFNEQDNSGDYAVIIGNGTANDARSNALTVGWSGNICMALDTTASTGTTDGDLYTVITNLGWQNDVIE